MLFRSVEARFQAFGGQLGVVFFTQNQQLVREPIARHAELMRPSAARVRIEIFGVKNVINAKQSPKIEVAKRKKPMPSNDNRAENFGFPPRFDGENQPKSPHIEAVELPNQVIFQAKTMRRVVFSLPIEFEGGVSNVDAVLAEQFFPT